MTSIIKQPSELVHRFAIKSTENPSITFTTRRCDAAILLGYLQSVGSTALLILMDANNQLSVLDMKNSMNVWSNSHLTFSRSGESITITTDVEYASSFTMLM